MENIEEKVKRCYENKPFPNLLQNSEDKDKTLDEITAWLKINLQSMTSGLPTFNPRKILVAGCGTGEEVIALTRLFNDVEIEAVDICDASLEIAQQNFDMFSVSNVTLKKMSILKELPNYNASFDLVFCSGVVHHLEEPETGFDILSTKVNQNGVLIVNLYHSYGLFFYKLQYSLINLFAGRSFDKRAKLAKQLKFYKEKGDKDETLLFDSYVNPQVTTFTIGQVNNWAKKYNLSLSGVSPPLSISGLIKFGLDAKNYVRRRKSIINVFLGFLSKFQGNGDASTKRFRYRPAKVFFYELIFLVLGKGECWYFLEKTDRNE